jgi:uncharacterized phiE125 gp8 family phage protein
MGGLALVTGPTLDLVALAEAKAHCRVTVPDDDALIAGYILAARVHCERHTGRSFVNQTYDLTFDNDWPYSLACGFDVDVRRLRISQAVPQIIIPVVPLVSVTSINYLDKDGISQLLASSEYRVITRSQVARGWIEPAWGVTWPQVRYLSEAITVRFVAGHGTQAGSHPYLNVFRQAMLLLIGHWYENREAVNVGSSVTEFPLGVASLLQPFVTDGAF